MPARDSSGCYQPRGRKIGLAALGMTYFVVCHSSRTGRRKTMAEKTSRTDAASILRRRYVDGEPARAAAVERERINAEVAQLIYSRRVAAGLTQKQLAELAGTKQSVISRLEDADYEGHSLTMLQRRRRAGAADHDRHDRGGRRDPGRVAATRITNTKPRRCDGSHRRGPCFAVPQKVLPNPQGTHRVSS